MNGQKLQGPPTAAEVNVVLKEKDMEDKYVNVDSFVTTAAHTLYSSFICNNASSPAPVYIIVIIIIIIIMRHRISDSAYCNMYPHVTCPSVHVSVTPAHPAKTVGQYEMLFGSLAGTLMWPLVTLYWRGPRSPTGRGNMGSEPPIAAISQPPRTVTLENLAN